MIKGRRYLQLVLLGIILYGISQLWLEYPNWYKNEAFINILGICVIIYTIAFIVAHMAFVTHVYSDGYTYMMDKVFGNYSKIISLKWAYILLPEIMLYEKLARFLDKHLTSHDKR